MRRAVAVSGGPALGFVVLLLIHAWAPVARLDAAVSDAFRDHGEAHPGWVSVLRVATDAASTLPMLVAGLAALIGLVMRRDHRRAAALTATVLVVFSLWSLLHWQLYRPRPLDGFVEVAANGFPSGHTANAAVMAVLAVWLLWPRLASRAGRVAVVAGAAGFAGFIGYTRVALLAHWPTDVLAGWLLVLAVFPVLSVRDLGVVAPSIADKPGHTGGHNSKIGEAGSEPERGPRDCREDHLDPATVDPDVSVRAENDGVG